MTTTSTAPGTTGLTETVARPLLAQLQQAWNAGDGAGFGAPFSDDAVFVDVRGERHVGGRPVIAAGHQAILDSIYRGSTVVYDVAGVQQVAPDVLVVHGDSVLDAPSGPLTGIHRSAFTIVLTRHDDAWQARDFQNTIVTA